MYRNVISQHYSLVTVLKKQQGKQNNNFFRKLQLRTRTQLFILSVWFTAGLTLYLTMVVSLCFIFV